MPEGYSTSPLGDDPQERFSFSDATMLTFLGVAALALAAVLLLGSMCAEHRIAAALAVL